LSLASSIKNKTLKAKISILHIKNVKVKVKVKQSHYRLEQALSVTGG
jgi:hypothetical protein